jgi:glycosyltransferase involved in cell wall biosynthesis
MGKLVSIIIPCYNSRLYLARAIESALSQIYSDFEVIIIDDGSTDETRDIAFRFRREEQVRYFHQDNRGLSSARNFGLRVSRGKYVALLDADDIWLPNKLNKQIDYFNRFAHCGMVFTDYSTFNVEGVIANTRNDDRHTGTVSYEQLLLRSNFIYPSTVLIRRDVFDRCGYFDESLKSIEDYDMWLRIAQQFEIRGVRESLTKIRIHESNMSGNVPRMLAYECKVVSKHRNNLSWFAFRRRLAKIYFLNADRYVHQRRRGNAIGLFFKGILLYPFLFVDMTVFFIKMALGGVLTERVRKHVAAGDSFFLQLYQWLYKRY